MIGPWRVGEHYKIHVYQGDRPVATFHNSSDAHLAVAAVARLTSDPGKRRAAAVEAIHDSLVMLGVDPDEMSDGDSRTTAEILVEGVLRAAGVVR